MTNVWTKSKSLRSSWIQGNQKSLFILFSFLFVVAVHKLKFKINKRNNKNIVRFELQNLHLNEKLKFSAGVFLPTSLQTDLFVAEFSCMIGYYKNLTNNEYSLWARNILCHILSFFPSFKCCIHVSNSSVK